MTYTSAYGLGPGSTPAAIKWLIGITSALSILLAAIQPAAIKFHLLGLPTLFLSLNWEGLASGQLWRIASYLFIPDPMASLSFGMLITLLFQMYLVWVMGSSLAERAGGYRFTLFYIGCGAIAGIIALFASHALGYNPFFGGPGASILALWVVWTMMHPDSELLFFFLLRVKARWLLAGIAGALLLVNLSQGNIPMFLLYLTAALAGYFYGVLAWGLEGPFSWMHGMDSALQNVKSKLSRSGDAHSPADDSKIIDIHTGKEVLDDDAFVDAMLTKISQKGEHSLSWSERRRLRKISERKR